MDTIDTRGDQKYVVYYQWYVYQWYVGGLADRSVVELFN